MEKANIEILSCDCGSNEHQLVMRWWEDDEVKEVYCSVFLKPLPFFKRLINGVKYIFGHKSIYGDFEEFIFTSKDAYKVQKIATFLKKKNK